MLLRRGVLLVMSLLSLASALDAESADGWKNVTRIPNGLSYMFVGRDFSCHFGQIKQVSKQNIVVTTGNSEITFDRIELLRIQGANPSKPFDLSLPYLPLTVVYSGRNSWADLVSFMPFLSTAPSYELRTLITKADGKTIKGNLKDVMVSEIVLRDSFGKETRVLRSEVSSVDYVREKPLSEAQEFYWQELGLGRIFDPVLYPRVIHIGDTMRVRLYDRALPEDNTPIICR